MAGWNADFITRISADRITPIYLLEAIPYSDVGRALGGDLMLSSAAMPGYRPILSPESSRIAYGAVQPREWSTTQGEWTIGLLSQAFAAVRHIGPVDSRKLTARGQIVRLRVGFPGWSAGQFQTVALGVVQTISEQGGQWSIRVRSILSSLTTRWDQGSVAQALFRELSAQTTTLAANYTAGSASVEVADALTIDRDEDAVSGGAFLLRITPTSGEPFLVYGSGTAFPPPTFTGLSSGILGTTAVDAVSGDQVEVLPFVKDHPFNTVRKILTSSGGYVTPTQNGAYDTLPASWGLNVDASLLDDADISDGITQHTPSGVADPDWYVWTDAEQTDAFAWIQSWLSPMGAFLCERQGMITVRGICTHFAVKPTPIKTWDVHEDDLVEIESYDAYDPSQVIEYSQVRIIDPDGDTTEFGYDEGERVSTRPALATKRIDLDFIQDDQTAWREHVRDAIAPYYTRVGEPVSILCRGWKFAQAAPGDHMQVHTQRRFLSGRRVGLGADLSTAAPILIVAVEPDWFGATTRIRGVYITGEPNEGV